MNDTQEVHNLFRGTAEVAKWIRQAALIFEIAAAAIAVQGVAQAVGVSAWRPILAFMFVAASVGIREYATKIDRFGEECRLASAFAFACGKAIPPGRASSLRGLAPIFAARLAARLPAADLDAYYDGPSSDPGEGRLREMYANSSFHTWRLMRAAAWLYGSVSFLILLLTLVVMFDLASVDAASVPRDQVLDALFTLVLAVLALRVVAQTVALAFGASGSRAVADALVKAPLPAGSDLLELTDRYNFERIGSPAPPSWLYRIMRAALAEEWAKRRRSLSPEGGA